MNFGDIRDSLDKIIRELVNIRKNTNSSPCCVAITSAGSNMSIPAGFSSIAIVQTSSMGTVDITMSDGSVFSLTALGEVFVDAGGGKSLPAYPISGSGTWKWHGIK